MASDTCRRPTCDNESRNHGDSVSAFGAKFCSDACELKYEHVRDDARDARQEDRGVPDRDRPEMDGPPY